jgi:hypothetical protein
MKRYAFLPRLIPVDDGMVFVYGDRALLFGIKYLPQGLIRAHGISKLEIALNPVARMESLVIFGKNATNYSACSQVCIDGSRGLMFSIIGAGFYEVLSEDLPSILADSGLTSLEGYMVAGHSRLMRRQMRKVGEVSSGGMGVMNGCEMEWVVVRSLAQALPQSSLIHSAKL